MTQRVQVPTFGNWEDEATIPYTVCFDRAIGSHSREEIITPSGHNPETLCSDSSPAQADPYSGKEKSTEEQEQFLEVPKFGDWDLDWDGQGDDVQYTVYFEKVSKRGSRGHTAYQNDLHNIKYADDARPPARKIMVEEKSPQNQKGRISGVIAHEEPTQESTNRLRGSSAASLKGHKKTPTRRNLESKHSSHESAAHIPLPDHQLHLVKVKGSSPIKLGILGEPCLRGNASRNEEVVPGTVRQSFGGWDESDPSQVSNKHRILALQSATGSNSSYHKSPTDIKEPHAITCCFPWGRR